MKNRTFCFLLVCVSFLLAQDSIGTKQIFQPEIQKLTPRPVSGTWGDLPYYFIQNKGQLSSDINFHLKLQHGNVFFERHAITYQFISNEKVENLRIEIQGANKNVQLEGIGKMRAKMNFFQGNNPDNWIEQACSFERLIYKNIYPRIDMVVYAQEGMIKHEYIVKKGGCVADIVLRYSNVNNLQVNDCGQLEITTSLHTLIEDTPLSYQYIDGKQRFVESHYAFRPDDTVTFSVGSYIPSHELIIDPSLLFSSYLGSSSRVSCSSVAVDLNLNIYIVGNSKANDFPATPGAFDAVGDDTNVLLVCLNPTGTELVYATYFGGSGNEGGSEIAFSWGDKTAVIVGNTYSSDLPTTANAYDKSLGGELDAFIAKFNANGKLDFATYFGGSDKERNAHVALDGQGKIYLAGETISPDLPTSPNAFDDTFQEPEDYYYSRDNMYIASFNPTGSSLVYSTFFGDTNVILRDIAVDYDGHAYVTGFALGDVIPTTPGAYEEFYTGEADDGFIARINLTGTALDFSSWMGDIPDQGFACVYSEDIDVDGQGNIYVTGAYQNQFTQACSLFVRKYNATASQKLWGSTSENLRGYGTDLVVDGRGGLYVMGFTDSRKFEITDNAFQKNMAGFQDLFIRKLKTSNGKIVYSTYFGGSGGEWPTGIVTDSFGSVYITGYTDSFDFPTTPNAFQSDFIAGGNGFVARIRDSTPKGELHTLPQKIKVKIPKASTKLKSRSIKVSNQGSGVVYYQIQADQTWLSISPNEGSVRNEVDQITVTIDPQNIKKSGTHIGVVRIFSQDAFNSPQQVPVQMIIPGPRIKVSKKKFTVIAEAGGENPLPLANRIKNSGPGKLRYRIAPKVPWLSVTRKKGTSTGEWDDFKIKTDISDLTVGVHSGFIEVTDKDTVNTVTIFITLNIIVSN